MPTWRLRRVPIAVAVVAALGAATVAYAAPISIVVGATASQPAKRLTPPGPQIGGCPVFPGSNAWNQPIASTPLHPLSAQIISHIQAIGSDFLHPDFGENPLYGIPFVVVPATQPFVPITYGLYGDESDPGPFPIPLDAPIEGGGGDGDSHVLVVQQQTCQLYELFAAHRTAGGWFADSGAKFDLLTGAPRTIGWTRAASAGVASGPVSRRPDSTGGADRLQSAKNSSTCLACCNG